MTTPPIAPPRANKFKAIKTECGNCAKPHPSKAEAKRCGELHLMQQHKLITFLQMQPRFECRINGKKVCTYVADFGYQAGGKLVVEDVKGLATPVYKLKKKLVEALYPGVQIVEVRR